MTLQLPQIAGAAGKMGDATASPEVAPDPLVLRDLPAQLVPGLYVHVPFCVHKCHYCDFYSITRQPAERMRRFVDLVLAEARLWAAAQDNGLCVRPTTIFFG